MGCKSGLFRHLPLPIFIVTCIVGTYIQCNDLNPVAPDVVHGLDWYEVAGAVLGVLVYIQAGLLVQAEGHDGVGVVGIVVRFYLRRDRERENRFLFIQ